MRYEALGMVEGQPRLVPCDDRWPDIFIEVSDMLRGHGGSVCCPFTTWAARSYIMSADGSSQTNLSNNPTFDLRSNWQLP